MSIIEDPLGNRQNDRNACELKAECLKLTGRSDVFWAKSVNYSQDGLGLVSRKAVKPGTNLILRMLKLPSLKVRKCDECVRATSMVEVRWVKEIMDTDGLSYEIGVRYVNMD